MGFRMLRTAAVLVAVVLLAGCVPGDPVITPEPEPDATPVFASDEEALAAATEAYAKYLEVSNAIRADGGADPDRVSAVVTSERLSDELKGFAFFSDQRISTSGDIAIDGTELQQYRDLAVGHAEVTIYACLDATAVRFIDSAGADVTPIDRPSRQMFEVTLESSDNDSSLLLLSGSELWDQLEEC